MYSTEDDISSTFDLFANLIIYINYFFVPYASFHKGDVSFVNETRGYFCLGDGATSMWYYNDMATLVFNSQEVAIKQLFHQYGEPIAMTVQLR